MKTDEYGKMTGLDGAKALEFPRFDSRKSGGTWSVGGKSALQKKI